MRGPVIYGDKVQDVSESGAAAVSEGILRPSSGRQPSATDSQRDEIGVENGVPHRERARRVLLQTLEARPAQRKRRQG